MSNIFLAYSAPDRPFADLLCDKLLELGHTLFSDKNLQGGDDWRHILLLNLRRSDVSIVLISEASQTPFSNIFDEIGFARGYASESDRLLIIPILLGDARIPSMIADIQALRGSVAQLDELADQINVAIAAFTGRRAAKEEKAAEVAKRIEINAAEYVEEAIEFQRLQESRNCLFGVSWYIIGFVALLIGMGFAFYGVVRFDASSKSDMVNVFILTLKTLVVIGLLGACAKYAFTLGKSYINESLKCADRMHAISFGKFYLRVYGEHATWLELKEVFQNWNIDRSSSFSSLDASQFDPKLIESVLELVRTMTGSRPRIKKKAKIGT
jgi:TIR domain